MSDVPLFTQVDISAATVTQGGQGPATGDLAESNRLLREIAVAQQKSTELLAALLEQVSLQHRQRNAELKAWKEANPQLAHFNGVLQLFAQLGAPLPQSEG